MNNMEISKILIEWGINIQTDNDMFDCLTSTYPQNCYYIDRFPLLVKSFHKYEQEELYYKKVLDKEVSKELFIIEELKFVNVLKKLWLYNQVYAQTDLAEIPNDKICNMLNENIDIIKGLKKNAESSKDNPMILDNVNHLELLAKLSIKEGVYSKIFFLDQKFIVIAYGMCFQLYLHDLSSLQLLKTITSTEGLYLRPYISE